MWQFVKHGIVSHQDAAGDTLRGHDDSTYQVCTRCGIPLVAQAQAAAENDEAFLQRVCEAAKRLSGLWSRKVTFTGCMRDSC